MTKYQAMGFHALVPGNINLGVYSLPPDKLKEAVEGKVERLQGHNFAFEISEELPNNWRQSIPLVLEAINK
jgi:hypothetical protein